ncbi:vesicle-associated membrane protein-associated protein A-like [Antedon mediterranea]|uniref:vesicle-associated membrane protein-associated protein A-like n=1 Tax=Antedon mediterranea TaxID=105859 RepID=UPI003AF6E2BC
MSDIKPTAPGTLLIIAPPTELTFKGPFTDVVTSELHLKNATNSNICFNIKTTAPRRYCVRPNKGVLEAEEDITVNVMLQPFEYDPQERPHKFMVQAMTAPPGEFDQETVWKYSAAESFINGHSYKLLSVFEMPISATTVPAASSPKAAESATIKDTKQLQEEISHLKHKITMLEKEKSGHNDSYIMTRDWKNSLQKRGLSDTIHSLVTIRDTNNMK